MTMTRRSLAYYVLPGILPGLGGAFAGKARGAGVFDQANTMVGFLPPGFVTARTGQGAEGVWAVVEDISVPGGRALAQTKADTTDHRFPLAIWQRVTAANVEVSVRFKAVAGRVDRAGGIAVRLTGPDDYYVVRANALENNVNFYRVVKGARTEIQGASIKVAPHVWHTLGLRAEGERFTVSFNGAPLFTAVDRTFPGAGKVALWTKADSETRFDTLLVTVLGP